MTKPKFKVGDKVWVKVPARVVEVDYQEVKVVSTFFGIPTPFRYFNSRSTERRER